MQFPMFKPKTEWVMPDGYPDLSAYSEVAIDLETKDPNLTELGPGWARDDGYIIGVAVAVEGGKWYFPIRHREGPNLDPNQTMAWVKSLVSLDRFYVMHNALYDLGWLWSAGVDVKGTVVDTMIVSSLLDENRMSYALNNVAKEYVGERKNEKGLREAAHAFGVNPKSEMWKLPSQFVGEYAEQDAAVTLKLWGAFKILIEKEEIVDIFNLEMKVLMVVFEMRKKGVRIDIDSVDEIKKRMNDKEKEILKDAGAEDVQIWSASSVAKAFDKQGISYPKTSTGKPSFTKNFLSNNSSTFSKAIVRAREINKGGTFIDSIIRHNHNGRIFAEFHSMKNDDGGAVTGRFSCSSPNLQQIPARDPLIAPLLRKLFIPEEGTKWGLFDYSSQEPRLVVHYASLIGLKGVQSFVDRYHADATEDFHQMGADIMKITRKQAKDINLGLFYGMGKNAMAEELGLPLEEAQEMFKEYHAKVPFVKALSDHAINRAAKRGVIRTILGRKCRFDKWEPNTYGIHTPKTYSDAYAEHGPAIKRAFVYRALNRLIQGSAADQIKSAMVQLHEEGIVPMLQIHDELDISVESDKQAKRIKEVMENCVKLNIPSLVDDKYGSSWGEAGGK